LAPFDQELVTRPVRVNRPRPTPQPPVLDSRFGLWFLGTRTWTDYVLKTALADLRRMMPRTDLRAATMLDVGCGHGQSLRLLRRTFDPQRLIGIDVDPQVIATARRRTARLGVRATLLRGDALDLPLADASVDLIFCHQSLHHLVDTSCAVDEFHRVLRPGGTLLLSESTRAYIHSWMIRLLFRHPMDVQRSADDYVALLRARGFIVPPDAVSYPYPWWSRPDLGLVERVLKRPPAPRNRHEETVVTLVARKGPAR
jgi:ubiquinone/menaquinone biosynthesis C-methylase UbiE